MPCEEKKQDCECKFCLNKKQKDREYSKNYLIKIYEDEVLRDAYREKCRLRMQKYRVSKKNKEVYKK